MNHLSFYDLKIHLLDNSYWDYKLKGDMDSWDPLNAYSEYLNPKYFPIPTFLSIKHLKNGSFVLAHLSHSKRNIQAIKKNSIKHIFIYRDPRDIIVSYFKHVTYHPEKNPPKKVHKTMLLLPSDEQRITFVITGIYNILPGIREILINQLNWLNENNVLVIRFEDLIGNKGGGSNETQKKTIEKICDYLSLDINDSELSKISDNLFGGNTNTMNKGQLGAWRDNFTDFHRELFKNLAGDLLIKMGYEKNNDW